MMRAYSSSSSSSSKSINGGESDADNVKKMKVAEPHLSGAYIRSLVKELTSSRNKDSSTSLEGKLMISDQQEKSHQQKRKVRRRVQTRKPYQERLLNMAEARKEIVSALKIHREAMKLKQQMKSVPEVQPFECFSSNVNTCNNFCYSSYSWPPPPPPPPPLVQENLDFVLPRQALGLNLNLQDFYNLEMGPSSIYTSSSASTSSSPPLSSAAEEIPHTAAVPQPVTAEFRDLDSSLNLVSSKFERDGDFVSPPFDDEAKGFPGWLEANGSCLEHVDDLRFNNHHFGDYALPCMKIDEIEGVDGEWLA